MKHIAIIAAAVIGLTACGSGERNPDLVGTWNWVEDMFGSETLMMAGAVVLQDNGRYSWLGTNYGALGFRWTSYEGVVSYSLAGVPTHWFRYRFVDANTISIEYFATPGIFYTLRRAR